MYNIDNQKQLPLINAYVDLELFEEKLLEEKYLFLAYQKMYISLYFDNGYRINHEDEFAEKELLSDGACASQSGLYSASISQEGYTVL